MAGKDLLSNVKGVVLNLNQKGEDQDDKNDQNFHVKPDQQGILRKDGVEVQALIVQGFASSD